VTPALTALELKTVTRGYDIDVRIVIQTDTTDRREVWKTDRWMGKQSENETDRRIHRHILTGQQKDDLTSEMTTQA